MRIREFPFFCGGGEDRSAGCRKGLEALGSDLEAALLWIALGLNLIEDVFVLDILESSLEPARSSDSCKEIALLL